MYSADPDKITEFQLLTSEIESLSDIINYAAPGTGVQGLQGFRESEGFGRVSIPRSEVSAEEMSKLKSKGLISDVTDDEVIVDRQKAEVEKRRLEEMAKPLRAKAQRAKLLETVQGRLEGHQEQGRFKSSQPDTQE